MLFSFLEKSGIPPSELVEVFTNTKENLLNLNVLGLMTIGSYEASTSNEINKDFQVTYSISIYKYAAHNI